MGTLPFMESLIWENEMLNDFCWAWRCGAGTYCKNPGRCIFCLDMIMEFLGLIHVCKFEYDNSHSVMGYIIYLRFNCLFLCVHIVNFQAPSLLGEKIAHQEVALPCWNDFCQLTSEGCGTQPLLKPVFPCEGGFGTCCPLSTTACLKAWAFFIWEWF